MPVCISAMGLIQFKILVIYLRYWTDIHVFNARTNLDT